MHKNNSWKIGLGKGDSACHPSTALVEIETGPLPNYQQVTDIIRLPPNHYREGVQPSRLFCVQGRWFRLSLLLFLYRTGTNSGEPALRSLGFFICTDQYNPFISCTNPHGPAPPPRRAAAFLARQPSVLIPDCLFSAYPTKF
jgi:hypothetical protein